MQEYEKPEIIFIKDEQIPSDDLYTYYSGQPTREPCVPQPESEKSASECL